MPCTLPYFVPEAEPGMVMGQGVVLGRTQSRPFNKPKQLNLDRCEHLCMNLSVWVCDDESAHICVCVNVSVCMWKSV